MQRWDVTAIVVERHEVCFTVEASSPDEAAELVQNCGEGDESDREFLTSGVERVLKAQPLDEEGNDAGAAFVPETTWVFAKPEG